MSRKVDGREPGGDANRTAAGSTPKERMSSLFRAYAPFHSINALLVRKPDHAFTRQLRSVCKRCANRSILQDGICLAQCLAGFTSCEIRKDDRNGNSGAFDASFSVTDLRIDCDMIAPVRHRFLAVSGLVKDY